MKNHILTATIFACALAILAGCAKEIHTPVENNPSGDETQPTVTRIGLNTEGYTADTKTSVLDKTVTWVDGDEVQLALITDDNTTYSNFPVTVTDDGEAYIEVPNVNNYSRIKAYYPVGFFESSNNSLQFPASYSSTIDAAGRQVIALPMMAYAENEGSGFQDLAFKHQTAAAKVMMWNATSSDLTVTCVMVKNYPWVLHGRRYLTDSTTPEGEYTPAQSVDASKRRVEVTFPGYGQPGALVIPAGDQTKSVQVPFRPIGEGNMFTVEIHLTDGTCRYVYKYTASNPALTRNQMMTARAKLDLDGHMESTPIVPVDLSTLSDDYEAQDCDILTGTLSGNYQITIADRATVTLQDVDITCLGTGDFYAGITCLGDATIILSGTNSVMGGVDDGSQGVGNGIGIYPGIFVPSGKTLTIDGTGSLDVRSNGSSKYAPGIGGYPDNPAGNIVIQGSTTVVAQGGINCAGIGAGSSSDCGSITITGSANVTAASDNRGAGIGSGYSGSCGDITISGAANVTATSGSSGAGIGSGYNGSCGDITISTTGTVTAQGGNYGAGIGSGFADKTNQCGNILISKGIIVATGTYGAAGIGTGYAQGKTNFRNSCGTITIENTVTSVTATKGSSASNCIGRGQNTSRITCGTVTFSDVTMYNGSSWTTTPTDGNTYGGLYLAISTATNTNDTWTLTPTD